MATSPTTGAITDAVLALDVSSARLSGDASSGLARVLGILRSQRGVPDIGRLETPALADLYVALVALTSDTRIRISAVGAGWYAIHDSVDWGSLGTSRPDRVRRGDFLQRIMRLLARTAPASSW